MGGATDDLWKVKSTHRATCLSSPTSPPPVSVLSPTAPLPLSSAFPFLPSSFCLLGRWGAAFPEIEVYGEVYTWHERHSPHSRKPLVK